MIKLLKSMKPLILIFTIFFSIAYIAIRIDQAMGWEHDRALKQAYIGEV